LQARIPVAILQAQPQRLRHSSRKSRLPQRPPQMIPLFTHTHLPFFLSNFLVIMPMRWHERLSQPSVSPATSSSTGDPRWHVTPYTGAGSLQQCRLTVLLDLDLHFPSPPLLVRHRPSLSESALADSNGRHSGSKTSFSSGFPLRLPHWRGNGRASGMAAFATCLLPLRLPHRRGNGRTFGMAAFSLRHFPRLPHR